MYTGQSQFLLHRSAQPLSDDVLSSVTLLLELLRVLLSCEVIGRVDTHTPAPQGTNGQDAKTIHNFESRTLSFPKSFIKALVTNKDGADLLTQLLTVLGERSNRAVPVPVKEEEEETSGAREEEEEGRILGEFSTVAGEIVEELDGIVADGQGERSCCIVSACRREERWRPGEWEGERRS